MLSARVFSTFVTTASAWQASTPSTPITGASGTPAPSATSAALSLFDYVKAGGPLGYVLIALSVVALALVIRNLIVLRITHLAPVAAATTLSRLFREGDLQAALQVCAQPGMQCFLTDIFRVALERCLRSPFGAFEVRDAIEESGQAATSRLHRLNNGIGIIAAVGPMLGLLGTVIGMIGAFHTIGSLQGAARSTELAKFMSLALVNTAEGLIVAIPCTVAFALFRQRVDRLASDVGETVETLTADLIASMSSAPSAPGAPTAPTSEPEPRAVSRAAVPAAAALPGSRGTVRT